MVKQIKNYFVMMKHRLNDYYGSRYELRNQPEAVEGRVNNMLGILQHMFGI